MKIQMRDFDYRTRPLLARIAARLRRPRPMATPKAKASA